MTTCPRGHDSADPDFCDVCGAAIAAGSDHGPSAGSDRAASAGSGTTTGRCPVCATPRVGRFCEECGHDFHAPDVPATPTSPAPSGPSMPTSEVPAPEVPAEPRPPAVAGRPPETNSGWTAVVGADRDYYQRMVAEGGPDADRVAFPPYCPQRLVPLRGDQIRIGRSRRSRDIVPELDLSHPPADPGVSHLHAVLLATGSGWELVDLGSSNGTLLAGVRLTPNVAVAVDPDTPIQLGAWTVVTLRRGDPATDEETP